MATEAKVPAELDGSALDAVVRSLFELSWGRAREMIARGKVSVEGKACTDALVRVRAGQTIVLDPAARRVRAAGLPKEAIVFVDKHVVVVEKPSGLATVPFDPDGMGASIAKRDAGTLDALVAAAVGGDVGVVHRIDKETSGLVVFSRTWAAKKALMQAFRFHHVHRRYLALAHGIVASCTYRTHLVADRGDGLRGSIENRRGRKAPVGREKAQLAVTHVEALTALRGATLVACRLETGRTHQIRIHLSEDGHPLIGERVYVRGFAGPVIPAPRLMLHAAELGFAHPVTGRDMQWTSAPPADFLAVQSSL